MVKMKASSLTIAQWHEIAIAGKPIPMKIPINGISMLPLIRRNRDMVTILPIIQPVQVGDIVLFADPYVSARYVLHRVWELADDHVLTWGDNCDGPDHEMALECIWGKAILIERGKRMIHPDPVKGLRLAKVWHHVGRWLRRGQSMAGGVKRRLKRLIHWHNEEYKN